LSKAVVESFHLRHAIRAFPDFNWRYVVIPTKAVASYFGIALVNLIINIYRPLMRNLCKNNGIWERQML
jgi:hypothetical protein